MDGTQILTLGLGLEAPWALKDQHLDTAVSPHRLDLYVEAERGSLYPCPECGEACPAHDFADRIWRHLNFFQHHCYLHARVPRTKCPEHGVKRIEVPWARPGSDFTLLFEQAAMSLVKEMPVLSVDCPGGIRSILKGGLEGSVVPHDEESLARGLQAALEGEPPPVQESWLDDFKPETVAARFMHRPDAD